MITQGKGRGREDPRAFTAAHHRKDHKKIKKNALEKFLLDWIRLDNS